MRALVNEGGSNISCGRAFVVYVCFLENHKPRFAMPLSERSRRSPHEYAVRVPPDIVERPTTMVSKEIECACDFCECRIATAPAAGDSYGNAEYFATFGVAKDPQNDPSRKRS